MYMRIILLTKSKKYHNYCVAGIQQETGKWVRLVSEDSSIHNAVIAQDMIYNDNTEAQILDIVDVKIKKYDPNYYQIENYTYDCEKFWKKVGQATIKDVLRIIKQNNDCYIFHDDQKKLSQKFVQSLNKSSIYSLKLIVPDKVKIQAKRWNINGPLKITASFNYNNKEYKYLSITDEKFNSKFNKEGNWTFNSVAFVLSLADLYDEDKCHYKLVASVIDMGQENKDTLLAI